MKTEFFLIVYSDEPLANQWQPIGVLVHDGKLLHLRMSGVADRNSVDTASFASLSPKAAANAWVYREWVDWLYCLIEEKPSLEKFRIELDDLAKSSANFSIVFGGDVETDAAPNYDHMTEHLFKEMVTPQE